MRQLLANRVNALSVALRLGVGVLLVLFCSCGASKRAGTKSQILQGIDFRSAGFQNRIAPKRKPLVHLGAYRLF